MYTVMIVDDELYARMRIKTELGLEQDGFFVAQEAVSGQEALEMIEEDPPDIILTDMRMPGLSGVELIREIRRRRPELPIIALSGYDDYEYVRASLKLGAVDYLLKHELTRESVLEALRRCAEQICLHEHREKNEKNADRNQRIGEDTRKRQLLLRLLHGEFDAAGEIPLFQGKQGNLQIIVMQLDHIKRLERENGKIGILMMVPVILSLLQEVLNQYASGLAESIGEGEFVIVASFDGMYSQQYIWSVRHKMIQAIRRNLEKYTNMTATFAVGRVAHQLSELPECFRQTRKELAHGYLTGENSLISVSDGHAAAEENLLTLDGEAEKRIALAVERHDRGACASALSGVFEDLMRREANKASCQVVCMELLNLIIRSSQSFPLGEPLQEMCVKRKGDILENESVLECRRQILEAYGQLFDFIDRMEPLFSYNRNTVGAIEYIHAHYQEDISLEEVAGKLNVNKSYLSRVFSHDCGKSFTEYVSWYRIEQAKRLLDEGVRIREIAEKVGIDNPSYFFRVFKNCTGVTPNSYVKMSKKCRTVK